MKVNKKGFIMLCLLPFLILALAFEILPFISVVMSSFKNGDGAFTLMQYKIALTSKFYLQSIINSFKVSMYSSIVGLVVSIIGSHSINKLNSWIKDKVLILSNMTSNFSGIPLAFAFIILIGNNGVMSILSNRLGINLENYFNLYSITGLTLVYIYFQIPLGILLLYPAYDGIKEEWEQAALMLGASRLDFWRYIGIPIILPSILGTFSILFANAIGAYATAIALTGGNLNLLSIRIGALVSGEINFNPELASALAVMLGLIIAFTNLVNQAIAKRRRWN